MFHKVRLEKNLTIISALVFGGISLAQAASTQIGDFRLNTAEIGSTPVRFDPGFGPFTTRGVTGSPVTVNSAFTGVSQQAGLGGVPDADDIALTTFFSQTNIIGLNRFENQTRVGAVQWNFDLSPIDGYLAGNNLDLTALDLTFVSEAPSNSFPYDVLLSYTNPIESITLTGLGTGADNFTNIWNPAQSAMPGDIVSGSHQVLALGLINTDSVNLNQDLLALYDLGVREFNLVLTSNGFANEFRLISVLEGSGLSIDTVPVPEPSAALLLGLSLFGRLLIFRRRSR